MTGIPVYFTYWDEHSIINIAWSCDAILPLKICTFLNSPSSSETLPIENCAVQITTRSDNHSTDSIIYRTQNQRGINDVCNLYIPSGLVPENI